MKLDDAALSRVKSGQVFEGLVQSEDIDRSVLRRNKSFIQGHLVLDSTPLSSMARTGVIHENLSHELRSDGKKVGSVLPRNPRLLNQAAISFVD